MIDRVLVTPFMYHTRHETQTRSLDLIFKNQIPRVSTLKRVLMVMSVSHRHRHCGHGHHSRHSYSKDHLLFLLLLFDGQAKNNSLVIEIGVLGILIRGLLIDEAT